MGIDRTYPPPRTGAAGYWDKLIGPGATAAEVCAAVIPATLAAIGVPLYALSTNIPWTVPQHLIAVLLAFDIVGGVMANATNSAKRWYHRAGQGVRQHLGFVAIHGIQIASVAWLFRRIDVAFFVVVYGSLLLSAVIILTVPLYLQRPVAFLCACGALFLSLYGLTPTPGFEWFIPLLFLKILVSHLYVKLRTNRTSQEIKFHKDANVHIKEPATMPPIIRLATEHDADQIHAIYAPLVRDTAISFEWEPPTPDEMRQRIARTLAYLPWLVYDYDGEVLGYVYASKHRDRTAYQWSVDVSVYIHTAARRSGVGRALYTSLFALLVVQGFYNAYAGATLPNPGSVALHESLGFQHIGVYQAVGYKAGIWHDVVWWTLPLQPKLIAPQPPISLPTIQDTPAWRTAIGAGLPHLRLPSK